MTTQICIDDIPILERAKIEELEGKFHHWLQSHFDINDMHYINLIVNELDDEVFCTIAEKWASDTFKNKLYY